MCAQVSAEAPNRVKNHTVKTEIMARITEYEALDMSLQLSVSAAHALGCSALGALQLLLASMDECGLWTPVPTSVTKVYTE